MSKLNLPKVGAAAPAFSLLNQRNEQVSLSDFKGKQHVVLYFYPKAMTPGCTVQACGIRDYTKVFDELNTVVLGVSPDKPERLTKFEERDKLNFGLLSDPEHEAAENYGVWGEKKFMGRTYMGVNRITFIIDKQGTLCHVIEKVKTKTHNDDVADWIRQNLS